MNLFRSLVAAVLSVGVSTAAQAVPLSFTSDEIVYDKIGFPCRGYSFCDRPDLTLGLRLSGIIDLPDLQSDFQGQLDVTAFSFTLTEQLPILAQPSPGLTPYVLVEYTAPTPGNRASLEINDFFYRNGFVWDDPVSDGYLVIETTLAGNFFKTDAAARDFRFTVTMNRTVASVSAALGPMPEVPAIPVPLALPLLGSALGCLGLMRLRRRKS